MRKSRLCSLWCVRIVLGFAVLLAWQTTVQAQIRDGGIDPKNLGKGYWIYVMDRALNQLNGNIPAVTNLTSMMAFLKNQGLTHVIIKTGTGPNLFPSAAAPQFNADVVNAAHAAGLWIFGYNYSYGQSMAGEIAIANYIFTNGADGFVIDAEIEWESSAVVGANSTVGLNGPALAVQLCSAVRSNWPNKFMAHAPFPYISYHASFPYKEFGYYCDAVMPQAYWNAISLVNCSPSQMVTDLSAQWRNWQNSLTGQWTNSIKPICAIGNTLPNSCNVNAARIAEFINALRNDPNPATAGGYKAANYWTEETASALIWEAIRTNNIGDVSTNAPVVTNVAVTKVTDTSATLVWTTDQSSDSAVDFGLTTGYGNSVTNTTKLYYHTMTVTGLSNNTTYQFRAKSKNVANQVGLSVNYNFTTLSAPAPDIIVDQDNANNTGGNTCAYTGSWSGTTAGSAYLGTFRYANPNYILGSPTATARFRPNVTVAGYYNVYASWASSAAGGNRAVNAPFRIYYSGGTNLTRVNEEANGNTFQLIATNKLFNVGTNGYVEAGNDVTQGSGGDLGDIIIADAVKLVYIPPPPAPPSITTPPSGVTTNQGKTVRFTVGATGTAPLVYQWKHAGTNLPGATTSSYTKSNVQPADAGSYSVAITNGVGFSNSSSVTLTIVPLPSPHIDWITILGDRRTQLQVSGGPGIFAVDQAPNLTTWTQAATTNVSSSVFRYTDPQTNQDSRYYRARLLN